MDENLQNGIYQYFVVAYFTNDCDSIVSNVVEETIKTEGIGEMGTMDDIVVYPNPAEEQLIVECRDAINGVSTMTTITNIEIFDVFGRNVSRLISHISHPIFIDISHLPSGIYFVRIQTENNIITKKIIKY